MRRGSRLDCEACPQRARRRRCGWSPCRRPTARGIVAAPRLAERLGLRSADRLIPARGTDADGRGEPHQPGAGPGPWAPVAGPPRPLGPGMNLPTPDAKDLRDQLRDWVAASIRVLLEQGGAVLVGQGGRGRPGRPRASSTCAWTARRRAASSGPAPSRASTRRRLETGCTRPTAPGPPVQRLYGRDPAEAALYHLVVGATVLPVDAVVELVASAAQAFWRQERDRTFDRCGRGCCVRASVVDPRGAVHLVDRDRCRQHDPQRRAAVDRGGPAHRRLGPAVDHRRDTIVFAGLLLTAGSLGDRLAQGRSPRGSSCSPPSPCSRRGPPHWRCSSPCGR